MSGLLFNLANLISGGDLKKYQKQAQETQFTLEDTQQQLKQARQQYHQLRTESDQNYAASIKTQEQLEQTSAELRQLEAQIHTYQQQQQQNNAELEVALAASEQCNAQLNQAYVQQQQTLAELDKSTEQRQYLQQELKQTQTKLQQSHEIQQSIQQQIYQLQQQLDTQQQHLEQYQSQSHAHWLSLVQSPYQIEVKLIDDSPGWQQLLRYNLNRGKRQVMGAALVWRGTLLGKDQPVKALRLMAGEQEILTVPVEQPRPNIAQKFTDIPYALNSGFECAISLVGIDQKEIVALAIFADDTAVAIATIEVTGSAELSSTQAPV